MTINLPDSGSPSLAIVQPSKAELLTQIRHNSVAWKGPLSVEAYLRREDHLAQQNITKNSGITYWVLVDTALPENNRVVLAGCESLRKRALIARDGKVEDAICHGVASVFTPPAYRGRGYGARMIKELGVKLKTWQAESGSLFSVLYSDIGKKFYTAHGWRPFPSSHIHLPPFIADAKGSAVINGHADSDKAQYLYAKDLVELCQQDELLLRQKLAVWHGENVAVALIPDFHTIEWHHAREDFVSKELYDHDVPCKGAIVRTSAGHRIWVIWMRLWQNADPKERKGNKLHIIRLAYDGPPLQDNGSASSSEYISAVAELLRLAQQEAADYRMGEVELWNPDWSTVKAVQLLHSSAEVVHRDNDNIASLKWYGEEEDKLDWVQCEKYAWC